MCWREDRHECNHSLGLSYNITALYLIPHAASVAFSSSRARRTSPNKNVVYRSSSARFWTELGKSGLLFHKVPTGHGADRSRCSYTDVSHLSHTSVIRPGRIPASLWAFANPCDRYKPSLLHATITTPPSSHRTHCCRSLRIPHAYMYFQPIRHVLESGDKARKAPSPALHHALLLLCFTQFRPRRR